MNDWPVCVCGHRAFDHWTGRQGCLQCWCEGYNRAPIRHVSTCALLVRHADCDCQSGRKP